MRVCMLNLCKEAGFERRKYKFLNLCADSSSLFLSFMSNHSHALKHYMHICTLTSVQPLACLTCLMK